MFNSFLNVQSQSPHSTTGSMVRPVVRIYNFPVPNSVLVTLVLLRDTTTRVTLIKESVLLGFPYRFRGLVYYQTARNLAACMVLEK